jgi:AraC family transcriptional activator of pobA
VNTISIAQFKQEGLKAAHCYRNDLIVTNHIEYIEQFKFPSRIDAITILVCVDGQIDCKINLKEYSIKANGILVNFPENIIQIDKVENFEAYAMLISSDYLQELQIDVKQKLDSYMNLREHPLTYVPYDEIVTLKYFYYLFKDNIENRFDKGDEIIKGLAVSFVFKIISFVNTHQKLNIDNRHVPKTNVQLLFEKFMSLLAIYHSQERSVKFYADKMNLTPNYLSSIIKEYSDKTATDWILEYVILEAKTLLKFSGLNIQQISYQLNFPSQSSFGKYFKHQTGISPKSYIKG